MEFAELILTPKLDGVVIRGPVLKPIEGTLCVTGHHLILSSRKENTEEIWLLHDNIDAIEKKSTSNTPGGSLTIKCKDFRILQLDISSTEEFMNLTLSLERLTSLVEPTLKYPFFYRPMYTILEDGWSAFMLETEFAKLLQGEEWRISHVNNNYSVCPSYPKVLIVPKSVDDESLIAAAKFREGGRFPILSYKHEGGAILMRSSQPLVGPNNKKCKEDEKLLNSITVYGKRGYIIDTRSQSQSQNSKSKGGGFETEVQYPHWRRLNTNIDRRQNLLDSLTKLIEACNDTNSSMDKWLSRLDSSNWLSHVKDTLNCACLIAQTLDQEKASILVHGSEGTDSTLIVTSLAQCILNPDCRTVRGLEAVIEREWLQGGYPFATRHAHSCYSVQSHRNKSEAPSFLLFLDCLYQIYTQFPCSFEFSPILLIWLFEHSYCSQFGTFLGNNEMEREKMNLAKNTASLWSYINRPEALQTILNPMYEPNKSVIWPSVAPVSINLWTGLYHRWVLDQSQENEKWVAIGAMKEREKDLRLKTGRLRRQLADLEKELAQVQSAVPSSSGTVAEASAS